MVAERLEGAYATLKRLNLNDLKEIHGRFQLESMWRTAGLRKPPDEDMIREDLVDEELFLWGIHPDDADDSVGYAGIVCYSGPPYVFVQYFEGRPDVDAAADLVMQLTHAYFQNSEEEELWIYVPKPVDDEIHERLIEGGFDPYLDDELPGIDLDKDAPYSMQRHTYQAYWGEGSEDPEI